MLLVGFEMAILGLPRTFLQVPYLSFTVSFIRMCNSRVKEGKLGHMTVSFKSDKLTPRVNEGS